LAAAGGTGETLGGQFFYTIGDLVDVPRKRSGMLSMVVDELRGGRVSIFNPLGGEGHPLLGVEFENASGLHLLPGPVSVIDGEAYAGDAQIDHTSRGETQLLAYAVDVDVTGSVERKQTDEVLSIKIVDGVAIRERRDVYSYVYSLKSEDRTRERRVVIEHPKTRWASLAVPSLESVDELESAYRFSQVLPAGESIRVTVVEESVNEFQIALNRPFSPESLLIHERTGVMSSEVANAIRRASQLQAQASQLEQQRAAAVANRTRLESDQERARQNLGVFERGSDGYDRFAKLLFDAETRIEEIDGQVTELEREIRLKQAELRRFLNGLDLR